jgi:hypothetical protein
MAIAPASALRARIRKMTDKKLRALHKTVNDPAQLKSIATGEGKTDSDASAVLALVNEEYDRRFNDTDPQTESLSSLLKF